MHGRLHIFAQWSVFAEPRFGTRESSKAFHQNHFVSSVFLDLRPSFLSFVALEVVGKRALLL